VGVTRGGGQQAKAGTVGESREDAVVGQ